MNEKTLQGADIPTAQALGKACLCFKPTHHTPHKTREIHAITHGAEELGDSTIEGLGSGGEPLPGHSHAGRAGRTGRANGPRGKAQEIGRVAQAWQMVSCVLSLIGQNNGHLRAQES